MIKCRRGAGFLSESSNAIRIATKLAVEEFDRYLTAEASVFRKVHFSHATTTDQLDQTIVLGQDILVINRKRLRLLRFDR